MAPVDPPGESALGTARGSVGGGSAPRTRSLLSTATLIAVFVAALIANLRVAGCSPIAWIDTVNDQGEVAPCLASSSCTLTGVSTSVPGQAHAVAWLELRTLLAWLGLSLDGVHLLIQILNAVGAVLVFVLARRLGGGLAGAVAVWIFLDQIAMLVRVTALHNSNLLLFLGAVFALVCTAVIDRPGFASVVLAAAVGAVLANVHLACAIAGVSVVWVAVLSPRRRIPLAILAAITFAFATLAIAPPSWLHNLVSLLQRPEGHPFIPQAPPRNPMMIWALIATGAWIATLPIRSEPWITYRRRAQGALAVIVPVLAAFFAAPYFGLYPEPKYLFHTKAACAVASAVPLALLAAAMLRRIAGQPRLELVEKIAPLALVVLLVFPQLLGRDAGLTAADERTPTVGDLTAIAAILGNERGWDGERVLSSVRTAHGSAVLGTLRQMLDDGREHQQAAADDGVNAIILVLDTNQLPDPLPENWRIIRHDKTVAIAMITTRSSIDWDPFVVCEQRDGMTKQYCSQTNWGFDASSGVQIAKMPPAGRGWHGKIRLMLSLRPLEPGSSLEIFMPRMNLMCGGRIVPFTGGESAVVDPDGRRAIVSAPAAGQTLPAIITLEWHVGSPECDVGSYDALVPFFIDGDAASIGAVESALRKAER